MTRAIAGSLYISDDAGEKHGQARFAALIGPLRPDLRRIALRLAPPRGRRTVDTLATAAQAATRIEQEGFTGVILAAPHGSIAVVSRGAAGLDEVARQVFADVEGEA